MANFLDTLEKPLKWEATGGRNPLFAKVVDYDKLNTNRKKAISTAAASLKSSVADILGLQSKGEEYKDLAEAQGIESAGALREAGAYATVEGINKQNAALAQASGDIQLFQDKRDLALSMGTTRAQLGGLGLEESGSGLDLLSSSVRAGTLQQQLTKTQTALDVGGYLTSAAAANASKVAAETKAYSALNLEQDYYKYADKSLASADTETKDLLGLFNDLPGLGGTREGKYTIKTLQEAGLNFRGVSQDPYADVRESPHNDVGMRHTISQSSNELKPNRSIYAKYY